MAVPKKRTSRRRRGMRRAHDALNVTNAVESCPSCGELRLRHKACDECGTYRSHSVLQTAAEE